MADVFSVFPRVQKSFFRTKFIQQNVFVWYWIAKLFFFNWSVLLNKKAQQLNFTSSFILFWHSDTVLELKCCSLSTSCGRPQSRAPKNSWGPAAIQCVTFLGQTKSSGTISPGSLRELQYSRPPYRYRQWINKQTHGGCRPSSRSPYPETPRCIMRRFWLAHLSQITRETLLRVTDSGAIPPQSLLY